ncbi:MAG TPA: Holliday junction resolvase RuvX [Pseudogracilibacillus sp.]|nr:Holliday junction resolvase RuvX [Pseudogracilibacillus sp.]
MRILGLDVGSKTIGVAVSDLMQLTATGVTTLSWDENNMKSADKDLSHYINEYEISSIVIGLPKNMDGSESSRSELSRIYAKRLERLFHIPTTLIDERLTTVSAERTLLLADVSRKKRKTVVDKVAAVLILQTYLDQPKQGGEQ